MSDDEGTSIYDEVEIEDMTFDEAMGVYQFPCPCGDKFQITLEDLLDEQDIAVCPSCSLMIRVIFDLDDLPKPPTSGTSGGQVLVAA
ncbi:diphthamide biosynthesis 3 [Fusarium coicis]|nr:diphthamide biosynthesis 3 [Fusarium coicis]